MVRKAFSLIELIFAIVIIGIVVISLPTMNQATTKGIEGNMVQEAIFAASTELNQVVTANWDDNSSEPGSINTSTRVIDDGTCGNNPLASVAPFYRLKIGHINQPYHRRCLDNPATGPSDANSSAAISLDEASHTIQNIFDDTTTDLDGYKQRYNSEINVTRPANFNGNNNNIKQIEVRITDLNGNLITRLVTYSANIGEIDYFKRSY